MRRWAMITTMNKRINEPIHPCPFPGYTHLDILSNSSILSCDDSSTSSAVDKGYLQDKANDNSAASIEDKYNTAIQHNGCK